MRHSFQLLVLSLFLATAGLAQGAEPLTTYRWLPSPCRYDFDGIKPNRIKTTLKPFIWTKELWRKYFVVNSNDIKNWSGTQVTLRIFRNKPATMTVAILGPWEELRWPWKDTGQSFDAFKAEKNIGPRDQLKLSSKTFSRGKNSGLLQIRRATGEQTLGTKQTPTVFQAENQSVLELYSADPAPHKLSGTLEVTDDGKIILHQLKRTRWWLPWWTRKQLDITEYFSDPELTLLISGKAPK